MRCGWEGFLGRCRRRRRHLQPRLCCPAPRHGYFAMGRQGLRAVRDSIIGWGWLSMGMNKLFERNNRQILSGGGYHVVIFRSR